MAASTRMRAGRPHPQPTTAVMAAAPAPSAAATKVAKRDHVRDHPATLSSSIWGACLVGRSEYIAAQTIDARVAELIDSKAGLAGQALDGSEEAVGSSTDVQHETLIALLTNALSATPETQ